MTDQLGSLGRRGIVVEINGPRRSGKSHIAARLCDILEREGYKVEVVPGYCSKDRMQESIATNDVTIIDN